MELVEVTVVRIYTHERAETLPTILDYLQKEIQIRGVSLFRAISGFGTAGVQNNSLLDLSFSLPLIIEFFDHPEKITTAIEHLAKVVKSEHLIFFTAQANGAQSLVQTNGNQSINGLTINPDEISVPITTQMDEMAESDINK